MSYRRIILGVAAVFVCAGAGVCFGGPVIVVEPGELNFTAVEVGTNPYAKILYISNGGTGKLEWEITEDCGWLSIEPLNGKTLFDETDEIEVSVNADGLSLGEYGSELTITDSDASNSPQVVEVNLSVRDGEEGLWVPYEYPTIQSAIDAAVNVETVIVADGTYTGDGNRDIYLYQKAITVRSENGPENCIIDCQGTEQERHRGFKFRYCWNYPVLDGFTIMNGYGPPDDDHESVGGGIYCYKSAPIIKNCILFRNTAMQGGGIRAYASSKPQIYNCKFIENTAIGSGGGFSNYYYGDPVFDRCIFISNNASSGGAIHCSRVYHDSNQGISNCLIAGNKAARGGGAYNHACEINYVNCTFVGNCATEAGSAILFHFYNERSYIFNSIVWGNISYSAIGYDDQIFFGNPGIYYSCIEDREKEGTNHNYYPMFRSLGYWDNNFTPEDITDDYFVLGDYHLLSDSPCIDVGDPSFVPSENETDLDGRPRIIGNRVDMGAYEFTPPVKVSVDIKPGACPNPVNVKSKGVLPVAILGTDVFDVNDIDISSIRMEGIAPIRSSFEDVATPATDTNECACTTEGPDGYMDLMLKFETQEIIAMLGEVIDGEEWMLSLTGTLYDGTEIEGTDCIIIRKKGTKE
jgi:predicted outer membrane repeat protein